MYISSKLHTRRNSTSGFNFPKSCCQTEMKLICAENKSGLSVQVEGSQDLFRFPVFFVCFTSRSPPCLQHATSRFVSGVGQGGQERRVWDCVRTRAAVMYLRVSLPLCICLQCVGWRQGHCFHRPSPSLPHPICHECHASGWKPRKWPRENGCFHIANGRGTGGNGSVKVLRRVPNMMAWMEGVGWGWLGGI